MTNVSNRYFSLSLVCERGAPRASPPGDGSGSGRVGVVLRPGGLQNLVDGGEAVADLVDLLLGVCPVRVVGDLPDAGRCGDRVRAVPVVIGTLHRPGAGEVPGVGSAVVVAPGEASSGVAVVPDSEPGVGPRPGQPRQR